MKRKIIQSLSLLLCILLLISYLPAHGYDAAPSWSLSTLDGRTISDETYAGKTQVLVFYKANMQNGNATCLNSSSLISDLKNADWINNPNIQVIAIESANNSATDTTAFINQYASNLDNVVFAYGGNSLLWNFWGSGSPQLSICAIVKDGEIRDMWDRVSSVSAITQRLTAVTDIGTGSVSVADAGLVPVSVSGQYQQSNARSMLSMVNDFRTGSDAWYWNADNTTKTIYSAGQLGELTYDYDLEKIAMQRAIELSVFYSHTRPDNTTCFTLTVNGTRSWGENIAIGYENAESVFLAWREDDEPYSGQGHRRNMLKGNYTAIGIGCFYANDVLYWVQEFGYSESGAAATSANNSSVSQTMYCDYSLQPMAYAPKITVQPKNVSVTEGNTATFTVSANNTYYQMYYQWYYSKDGGSTWTAVKNNGTSATYTLTARAQYDQYLYLCGIRNSFGIRWTDVVTLTVNRSNSKPTITTQPSSVTVTEGNTATFRITATGATGYQWYYSKDGGSTWTAVKNNGTSAAYTMTAKAQYNGYRYRCKVTNAYGSVYSATVKLTVNCKPQITTQPSNVTVTAGNTGTFRITATGATGYQWYYSKDGGSTWTAVKNNGTSATYTLTAKAQYNGYLYRCKVTNAYGSVYSGTAKLTVR